MKNTKFFKILIKFIINPILFISAFVSQWGFYAGGVWFMTQKDYISAILSLLFALVTELKRFVNNSSKKRPKDILKRINAGRFDSVTVRYGRTFTHELQKERSAFQHGFDSGCDFILNLEEK